MNIRSYVFDVKVFLRDHRWVAWFVLPIAALTLGVFLVGAPIIGGELAAGLSSAYMLLGAVIAVVVILGGILWRYVVSSDDDGRD